MYLTYLSLSETVSGQEVKDLQMELRRKNDPRRRPIELPDFPPLPPNLRDRKLADPDYRKHSDDWETSSRALEEIAEQEALA
jgi:hypothetical protein